MLYRDQLEIKHALAEHFTPSPRSADSAYYHRGAGVLRRRVVDPEHVFERPLDWPVSEPVAVGSKVTFDAGNANATVIGDTQYICFYSGKDPDTAVLVSALPAPTTGNAKGSK